MVFYSVNQLRGEDNLAPCSYFNSVADEPPMVMFSTTEAHAETGEKDTLRNAEETGEFVVASA